MDYYILVDPKGFIALVDELDRVDVRYIPEDMNYGDPTPGKSCTSTIRRGPTI